MFINKYLIASKVHRAIERMGRGPMAISFILKAIEVGTPTDIEVTINSDFMVKMCDNHHNSYKAVRNTTREITNYVIDKAMAW